MKKTSIVLLFVLVFTLAFSVTPAFACYDCGPGVGTPGYWKNHPEAWPVDVVTLGGVTYTKTAAIEIMNRPVQKDKTITMFKAAVATYLNLADGNCAPCIEDWLAEADEWLGEFPVGTGITGNTEAWQYSHGEKIYWMMDAYNNGLLCAAPRD